MPLDLDKLILTSTTSALRNFGSGEFTVSISGVIAPSGTGTWSGSAPFAREGSLVRLYAKQNTVPVAASVDYTANDMLPCPPYGSFGFSPLIWVGCSVAGDPTVTIIDVAIKLQSTTSGLTVTATIFNYTAGNMTLTPTVLTFRYIAFLPT